MINREKIYNRKSLHGLQFIGEFTSATSCHKLASSLIIWALRTCARILNAVIKFQSNIFVKIECASDRVNMHDRVKGTARL